MALSLLRKKSIERDNQRVGIQIYVADGRNCQWGRTKTRQKSKRLKVSLTFWFQKIPCRSEEACLDPSACWETLGVLS